MRPTVLDVTCGGRTMWFQKDHPSVLYGDFKPRPKGSVPDRPNWHTSPDIIHDFTALPYRNAVFNLVVFDPPHLYDINPTSIMGTKYGSLEKDHWQETIRKGFHECWRVLAEGGSLVFKWNEGHIKLAVLLELAPVAPFIGHRSGKKAKTIWLTFHKTAGPVKFA